MTEMTTEPVNIVDAEVLEPAQPEFDLPSLLNLMGLTLVDLDARVRQIEQDLYGSQPGEPGPQVEG